MHFKIQIVLKLSRPGVQFQMTFPGGRKRLSFSYLYFHNCSAIIKKLMAFFKCHLYTDTNTVCSFFKMPCAFVLFESSTGTKNRSQKIRGPYFSKELQERRRKGHMDKLHRFTRFH